MKRLLAGLACLFVLTGCSKGLSPADQLKDQTAVLVEQANAKDLNGLRVAIDQLRTTIRDQLAAGQLTAARAAALTRLLAQIERDAPTLTEPSPTPTPSPTASPTASPTPSPTPSPTASPTPSPTPSPTASPTPPPTTAPPTTPPPTIGVGLGGGGGQPTP